MKKTKIICTMGPNTNDRELIKKLALAGMDVARFNFSHGDHEEQAGRMALVKSVREEIGKPIATLLDTKGPEIRTGSVAGDKKVTLVAGQKYTLTTKEVEATDKINCITYAGLPEDVTTGNTILIDDGLIELCVDEVVDGTDIICTVVNGGELGSKKGVNVPNVSIKLPGITDKDKDDIVFGIEQGFDFIAASFVRNAACIQEIKQLLWSHDADIPVIAKIENAEGIENLDEIIKVADGIMVARGDMGVEIPAEDVPGIQKEIIAKCNAAFKPVITATQMLDSMIRNPRPTRAEVNDVANAIYDGTDVVMLSGETANGKYPLEALTMMAKIAEKTEQNIEYNRNLTNVHTKRNVSSAVCNASVQTAANLGAKAIICPTISGFTARLTSKLKPAAEVIGCSPYDNVLRKMQLYWGVRPVKSATETNTDKIIEHAVEVSEQAGYIEEGDTVIISAGIATTSAPTAKRGLTNTMRVVTL
ncbi:pyruvate kinase [Lachnospira multipara]|uniref:pyruvate kinase n=1 Tax=Lachnospira multipara TaxID=28051 RepID=UPI0004E2155A|nr:pyruvate kinase [Lachnospira multipara]